MTAVSDGAELSATTGIDALPDETRRAITRAFALAFADYLNGLVREAEQRKEEAQSAPGDSSQGE